MAAGRIIDRAVSLLSEDVKPFPLQLPEDMVLIPGSFSAGEAGFDLFRL